MNSLYLLLSLDPASLALLFWFTLLFDLPRYVISLAVITIFEKRIFRRLNLRPARLWPATTKPTLYAPASSRLTWIKSSSWTTDRRIACGPSSSNCDARGWFTTRFGFPSEAARSPPSTWRWRTASARSYSLSMPTRFLSPAPSMRRSRILPILPKNQVTRRIYSVIFVPPISVQTKTPPEAGLVHLPSAYLDNQGIRGGARGRPCHLGWHGFTSPVLRM